MKKPKKEEKAKKPPKNVKPARRGGKRRNYDRYRIENRRHKNKLRRIERTIRAQPKNLELQRIYAKL